MLHEEDIRFYSEIFKELPPDDLMDMARLAGTRTLSVGEIYIHEGALSFQLAFIKKGLLRAWTVKDNDEEITFLLRWENQFVASMDTILYKKPSRLKYQALEETVLLEMDYTAALPIIDRSPQLSALRSSFLLRMLSAAMDRVETFVLLSPEERYRKMLLEKPDLINRVPDKYLATFLGITPVSLSRIRKRISLSRH